MILAIDAAEHRGEITSDIAYSDTVADTPHQAGNVRGWNTGNVHVGKCEHLHPTDVPLRGEGTGTSQLGQRRGGVSVALHFELCRIPLLCYPCCQAGQNLLRKMTGIFKEDCIANFFSGGIVVTVASPSDHEKSLLTIICRRTSSLLRPCQCLQVLPTETRSWKGSREKI